MDVLIVEDEPALLEGLKDGLSEALPGIELGGALSVEAAEALLAENSVPQLIISDIRLPGKSGVEFVLEVRERWPEVRFILMSAFASAVALDGSSGSGGVRFLRKPFDLSQLISEVRAALDSERFAGRVEGITVVDLLQLLNMSKRTAALEIRHGSQSGEIFVAEGEIVHATLGARQGVDAFNAVLCWRGGACSLQSGCSPPRQTIRGAFDFLLMEALRLADEELAKSTGQFEA